MPGDPLYFQIATGFGASVASGVVNAIQNAVTNVAVNIDVIASDPRVHIVNHTGINSGIGSGQTATFDIEFIGDGAPHRFGLQFVRSGTNVILGSIPVVLGTPNGLVFDVNNLATTTLTASDFIFRMKANTGLETANPSTWLSAPAPTVVNVTPGTSA